MESLAIDEGQEISFIFAVAEGEGDSAEKSELEQEVALRMIIIGSSQQKQIRSMKPWIFTEIIIRKN